MCVYIHSHIPTYTILRGNGQNNLLLEVHDQKYLNTAAKTRVMFLKHYYDYISLLLKTFTCLSSFFQDEIQLLTIACVKSYFMAWAPLTSPHHIYLSLHTLNTAYFLIPAHHLPMPNTHILYPVEVTIFSRSFLI